MKKLYALLIVLIMIAAVGCVRVPPEQFEEEELEIEIEPEEEVEPEVEEPPTKVVVAETTDEEITVEPVEDVVVKYVEAKPGEPIPFDTSKIYQMLVLKDYKLRKISRDRGEVREVTFTLYNTLDKPLTPRVTLWFHAQKERDQSMEEIQEKIFDLPRLEPGYKITKTYPVGMYFHYLENDKKIELFVKERFVSPSLVLHRVTKTFHPATEMEGMEIKWT